MYAPRSESEEFMYGDDEENFAPGDPEHHDIEQQKKKDEREERQRKWVGLKHLKLKTAKPIEEEPFEESTPQEHQGELSDLTGPAGSRGEDLDQAVGARTGTGSALGELPPQLPAMGAFGLTRSDPDDYAIDMAFTNIRKVLGDPVGTTTLESVDRARRSGQSIGRAKPRTGHRTKAFPRPIGGRSPWASTKRRGAVHQRLFGNIKGTGGKSIRSKSKTGMMRQRYTLSPHHLGVGSLWGKPRPGRLEDPGKYLSWLGRQSTYRRAGGAGVLLPYTPHAPREQLGQIGYPGVQGSGRLRLAPGQAALAREGPQRATKGPPKPKGMGTGVSPLASASSASPLTAMFSKSELEELVVVSKAYVRQLGPGLSHIDMGEFKELLRELKHLMGQLSRKSLMGIPGGGISSAGEIRAPANGPVQVSAPTGGTETDPEDLPEYWGADPAGLHARRGGHRA
jgi:hypothetical protein